MSYAGYQSGLHPSTSLHSKTSSEIRLEIQRFESVHPSIYAIYDLIEGIADPHLQNQIRDHVVSIEDSFVNSQEWTMSREVPDLKIGIVGYINSGKSALVHRYLTGSYMPEESPEGGRFKKEVVVDNQSYLLLIRDEGGEPEDQFTNWIDAVIFVFSVENETSFNAVPVYYNKMCCYKDMSQTPIILVGTQDAIDSENRPRVIEESRAKQLEAELGSRCKYYETCATYGLNVEIVFQDACHRALLERMRLSQQIFGRHNGSVPQRNPSGHYAKAGIMLQHSASNVQRPVGIPIKSDNLPESHQSNSILRDHSNSAIHRQDRQQRVGSGSSNFGNTNSSGSRPQQMSPAMSQHVPHPSQLPTLQSKTSYSTAALSPHERQISVSDIQPELEGVMDKKTPNSTPVLARRGKKNAPSINVTHAESANHTGPGSHSTTGDSGTDNLATPSSTPTHVRKYRRSSLFLNPRKEEVRTDELGSGRAIPVKQGYLYKKGSKGLTKDWKKKYVTLTAGKLIYHPNIHNYMEDVNGKQLHLIQTTVKIPGQNKPRLNSQISNGSSYDQNSDSSSINGSNSKISPRDGHGSSSLVPGSNGELINPVAGIQAAKIDSNTPHTKRKHRRAKSGTKIEANGDGNDSDGYEFTVVSLDNKNWQFEASTLEERDEWVHSIEKEILSCLQGNDSQRKSCQDPNAVQAIRNMPGNSNCCDCGTPNPTWASLNLGSLICIECSGIHRNLGTHLSRVRSLELDEWPPDQTAVMLAIGNQRCNSVWEANAPKNKKPQSSSSREEKEAWIRLKYETKEFLLDRTHRNIPLSHLLIDSIARQELLQVMHLLAISSAEEVNTPYSQADWRTPLHIAAQQGNAIFLQLLLWYGADVKRLDQEGRSALWYAKQVGSKDCAMILSTNGCPDATLPRLRRGSLRTPVPNDPHRDRTSLRSLH